MPKYRVSIPYLCWVDVVLEAEDPDDAENRALECSSPTGYAGYGGTNKLIGIRDSDGMEISITASDAGSYEGEPIEIEPIEGESDE